MKNSTQDIIASTLLAIGLMLPWPKKGKVIKQQKVNRKYAFIGDPLGEAIYKEAGFNLITRLPFHTMIGILTGDTLGEYAEVAMLTEDGSKEVYVWVRANRIYIKHGQQEAAEHLKGAGREKTEAEFNNILEAFK